MWSWFADRRLLHRAPGIPLTGGAGGSVMRVVLWSTAVVGLRFGLATAAVATTGLLAATAARAGGPGPVAATTASVRPTPAIVGRLATFTVSCASLDTAAATLLGQSLGLPALISMNAAPMEGDFVVTVRLPSGVRPGSYRPRIECSDGTSATVALQVESVQTAAAARAATASARTATATPTSSVSAELAAGGVALMALGALAGGSALGLLRRGRAHP
jgi:hypothetical protein